MIARWCFWAAIAASVLPAIAAAQDLAQAPRIGLLVPRSYAPGSTQHRNVEAFRRGLAEHGYVEGRNIVVEYRSAEGDIDRLGALADELVRRKVALVVCVGEEGVQALKRASAQLPIVVAVTGDLVATGHAASLARPGGNVTGLINASPDLTAKRLQFVAELVPKASRVAVLWSRNNPISGLEFQEAERAARSLGLVVQSFPVAGPRDFEPAFASMRRNQAMAALVLLDALTVSNARELMRLATQAGLPAISGSASFAEAGALVTYGADTPDLYRRAAGYVDKILKGAKPADLPIQLPAKFELVVNVKTAKALGITIPQSLLLRADHVIQ